MYIPHATVVIFGCYQLSVPTQAFASRTDLATSSDLKVGLVNGVAACSAA